ncbi:MAG: hypothetical protein IKI30_08325 [Oxalobacter sp.]|nr:hypothetical protein [Oxalobacter sp.]
MNKSPIEHILLEQKMLFGNLFEKQWGNVGFPEMIEFWERKLSGFSPEELRRGYKALNKLKYPPTLPEFMQLCRPSIDKTKAYYEAVKGVQERRLGRKGEWSHRAIFWAAASMAFDLLNMSYQQVRSRFEKVLDDELEKTFWPEIPEACTALPPPKVDREKAKVEAEAALKRIGAANAVPSANGNGQWIVRNLERMKEGWKPLPGVRACILRGAEALGIPIPEGIK